MTTNDHECGGKNVHQPSRRGFVVGCGAALAFSLAGGAGTAVASHDDPDAGPKPVAPLLEIVAEENWGRWGADDELGAINLLGSEEMFEGLNAATRRGKKRVGRFTLQTPITGEAVDALVGEGEFPTTDTGDPAFPGRMPARRDNVADAVEDPLETESGVTFADDWFANPLFLQGTTHLDALGHGWYDGTLYNGFDAETTHTSRQFDITIDDIDETFGLGVADIANAAGSGVAGRGVLLDVGRHKADEEPYRLDLGEPVTLDDLTETADAQGVKLEKHDILLVRTGAVERVRDPDAEWDALDEPGLTYSDDLVRWVRDMEIPVIGADNLAVEKVTQAVSESDLDAHREDLHGLYVLPLHGAFLRDLGVTINEILDLSELAAQCAEDGIYEFLYTAAPLHAEMGTGAPVNPVVLKATD